MPWLRHCHPCRASSFFRPFSILPMVMVFTLSYAWNWETVRFFFSRLPRSQLGGLAFAVLACFPPGWNGGFHFWRYSGGSLGRLLRPVVSPRFKCPGCWFTWSPGLFLLELLPPSHSGCGIYRCPSLFFTPFASLVFLENFGFVGVDGGFSSGFWAGVHLWVVLSARYPARPRLLLP